MLRKEKEISDTKIVRQKMFKAVIVLCLMTAVLAALTEVNVTSCNDNYCKVGCQADFVKADSCFAMQNGNNSVMLLRDPIQQHCVFGHTYSDAACTKDAEILVNVCGGCQFAYSLTCDPHFDDVTFGTNCTSGEWMCENCKDPVVVTPGVCAWIGIGYVKTDAVRTCGAVEWKKYAGTTCQGAPIVDWLYPEHHCLMGTIVSMANGTASPRLR